MKLIEYFLSTMIRFNKIDSFTMIRFIRYHWIELTTCWSSIDVDACAAEQRIVIDQGYVWGDLYRMGGWIERKK